MFATKNARRVIIIVDSSLESQILEKIAEMGVRSYNIIGCRGRGVHATTGDLFKHDELVRIEIVTSERVASDVLEWVHATQFAQFGRYALTAYVDTVEVDLRDKSLA